MRKFLLKFTRIQCSFECIFSVAGARTLEEGLDVHVQWSDGFDAWIYHAKVKEQLFRLPKLVDFYESKTKK